MALFSALYPLIRLHIRNCPEPTMSDAILRIARDFCRETRYVRETVVLDADEGETNYTLASSTPTQLEPCGIKAVQFDGYPLDPGVRESIDPDTHSPQWYTFDPPSTLVLYGAPGQDEVGGLEVRLILQPTLTATQIPDAVVMKYDQAIADGVIGYLAAMPKAGWFEPEIVGKHDAAYRKAKDRARTDADRDQGTRAFRTRAWGP